MKTKLNILFLFTLLVGCSSMNIQTYKSTTPEFILEEYFEGKTMAYGVFENRSSEVVRQFKVEIDGRIENGNLILNEDFTYSDGEKENRLWTIKILPDGKYEGTTNGVVGTASGQRAGNAFNWIYIFDLVVDDTTYRVKFNDWMFLQEDGVMINRAHVTKWGFNVGNVTLAFHKP
ncbi:MAG: DUF3833 domain-containing protein [Sphingomonadales bacterium]|jgi:hypothetical protein